MGAAPSARTRVRRRSGGQTGDGGANAVRGATMSAATVAPAGRLAQNRCRDGITAPRGPLRVGGVTRRVGSSRVRGRRPPAMTSRFRGKAPGNRGVFGPLEVNGAPVIGPWSAGESPDTAYRRSPPAPVVWFGLVSIEIVTTGPRGVRSSPRSGSRCSARSALPPLVRPAAALGRELGGQGLAEPRRRAGRQAAPAQGEITYGTRRPSPFTPATTGRSRGGSDPSDWSWSIGSPQDTNRAAKLHVS